MMTAESDRLLAHKEALFDHLVNRWRDLFNASFDVLLYARASNSSTGTTAPTATQVSAS